MNETKLKPCPFCGCPATLQYTGSGENLITFVQCDGCGAKSAPEYASFNKAEERVTEAWNERTMKRGHWENVAEQELYCPDENTTITTTTQTCSNCKVRTGFVGPKLYISDAHCPNCGADMNKTPASV